MTYRGTRVAGRPGMKRMIGSALVLTLALAPVACSNSQEKARAKLATMRVQYSDEAFVERAKAGDLLAIEQFLAAGMNINAAGKDGKTALIAAAEEGRAPMVARLLAAGADVNAREKKFQASAL